MSGRRDMRNTTTGSERYAGRRSYAAARTESGSYLSVCNVRQRQTTAGLPSAMHSALAQALGKLDGAQ